MRISKKLSVLAVGIGSLIGFDVASIDLSVFTEQSLSAGTIAYIVVQGAIDIVGKLRDKAEQEGLNALQMTPIDEPIEFGMEQAAADGVKID